MESDQEGQNGVQMDSLFWIEAERLWMWIFTAGKSEKKKHQRYSTSCSNYHDALCNYVIFYVNFKWPYLCENLVFFIQITTEIKPEFCCFGIYKAV